MRKRSAKKPVECSAGQKVHIVQRDFLRKRANSVRLFPARLRAAVASRLCTVHSIQAARNSSHQTQRNTYSALLKDIR